MSNTTCAECGGIMQPGYILDRADFSVPTQATWIEGEPRTGKFLGIDTGLDPVGREHCAVTTYRCERCGLLKSYARPGTRR